MRDLFLANAAVVLSAVSDQAVANAWTHDSILEAQTVGSLAGHLARGSVWVVGDYLDASPPNTPVDFETAAEYFAAVASALTSDDHASIRGRGAAVAAAGHQAVVTEHTNHLAELTERLAIEPVDRLSSRYSQAR